MLYKVYTVYAHSLCTDRMLSLSFLDKVQKQCVNSINYIKQCIKIEIDEQYKI